MFLVVQLERLCCSTVGKFLVAFAHLEFERARIFSLWNNQWYVDIDSNSTKPSKNDRWENSKTCLPTTHSRCWEHLHKDEVLEIARKGEFWNFVTFPWRGNLRMKNVKLVQLKIQNMGRFHWNRGRDLLTSFLSTLLIDSEFSSNKYKLNPSANAHNTETIFVLNVQTTSF